MKVVIKRISCFFLAFALIFIVTFSCFNRPVKTHADVLSALALGSGALGALVCAYMATAGVQITGGSSDADGSFLGNYVANWVKSSSSFPNNAYFNSDGEFIGSETDLSIVQNTNTGLVSFIFGKEFAIWLEAVKQSFVSSKNLNSNSSVLTSQSTLADYPIYEFLYNDHDPTLAEFYDFETTIIPDYAHALDARLLLGGHLVFEASKKANNATLNCGWLYDDVPSGSNWGRCRNDDILTKTVLFYAPIVNSDNIQLLTVTYAEDSNNLIRPFAKTQCTNTFTRDLISTISLDGSLTDGYEDFEDAINNDLTNADEDEVAVVDVGTFPNVLDPSLLVPDILDRAVVGELNPTYEGTREDTGTAEDEKDNEKPFSPTVPEGWVIVNGLEDFFPFCIPWDFYNLIAELNVPPKAPKFTYKVDLDAAIDGLEYEAELDLAPFESVANVFRIIVVIGFVFFLILKTRDLIRG